MGWAEQGSHIMRNVYRVRSVKKVELSRPIAQCLKETDEEDMVTI